MQPLGELNRFARPKSVRRGGYGFCLVPLKAGNIERGAWNRTSLVLPGTGVERRAWILLGKWRDGEIIPPANMAVPGESKALPFVARTAAFS